MRIERIIIAFLVCSSLVVVGLATAIAALSKHPLHPLLEHSVSFALNMYSRASQRQETAPPSVLTALSPFYLTSALRRE